MILPSERLDTFSGDSVTDLLLNVSLGQIPDSKPIFVVGHNSDITAGTTELLWPLGGTIAQATGVFPLNAVTCYVSSSSLSDVGNVIRLYCIASDWTEVEIGVTLNGQTAIVLPIQIRRVTKMVNVGNTAVVGNIYAGVNATPTVGVPTLAQTMNVIEPADQNSHSGFFTVPLGFTALIYEFAGGTPTNDSLTVSGYFSNPTTNVYQNGMHLAVNRGHTSQRIGFYAVPEKTDIFIAGKAYTQNAQGNSLLIGVLLPSHYMKS